MNSWKSAALDEVADIFNGKTPSKAEQRAHGHPVLKIKDVNEFGEFRGTFQSFVDAHMAERLSLKHVRDGDTLILNAAHSADYVGSKTYLAQPSTLGALATGEWLIVRPAIAKLHARFVNHWLNFPHTRRAIRDMVKGIHLYPKDVARLRVPLPSLSEQTRISEILDKADALRGKRRGALIQLDALTRSIFLDMFGDPATNPKGWPCESLVAACHCYSGGTPSKQNPENWRGRLAWFSPKDLKQTDLFDSEDHIRESIPQTSNLKLLPADTVAIVVRGMILAHTFPVSVLRIPATINQDLKALLPRKRIDAQFLAHCLRVQSARVLSHVSESAHGTKRLDADGLKSVYVLQPPTELQGAFAALVIRFERAKSAQRASLERLDALFAALQHKAFRGEL